MSKPIAVLISDVHYTPANLHLSHSAMKAALRKAEILQVPLVDCGDILDSKAVIRAECANALIELFGAAKTPIKLLVGNHTLVNEKGKEHSLNFLRPYAQIIDQPTRVMLSGVIVTCVPYQTDPEQFTSVAKSAPAGSILIGHQGISGANMGDYVVDKSSVQPQDLAHLTCLTGHFHRHQTIGTATFVGNPYSMSFGEANDGPKGFLVLNDDGTFTREILDLRRHIIIERTTANVWDKLRESTGKDDLLWLKVTGPASELNALNKADLAKRLIGHANFKFDRIYSDTPQVQPTITARTPSQMVDDLIDASGESEDQRAYLKALYREIME